MFLTGNLWASYTKVWIFKSTTISYFKLIHFLTELKQLQASHPQSWHTLQWKENHSFFLSQYNFHSSSRGIQWLLWSSRSSLWRQAKAKGVQTHFWPSHRSLWSCRQHVGLQCSTRISPTSSLPPTCSGAQHLEGREQSQGNWGGIWSWMQWQQNALPTPLPRVSSQGRNVTATKQFIFGSAFWTKKFTFGFTLKAKAQPLPVQPLWMENK